MSTNNTRMSTVEKLPNELLANIMSCLKPDDVLNLMLTSKRFCGVAKGYQLILANSLLHNHCTPESIQMAIAHHAAAVAEWKPSKHNPLQPAKLQDFQEYRDHYLKPREKLASLPEKSLSLRSVRYICAFHDSALRLARDYVDFCLRDRQAPTHPDLGTAHRAVYIIAIICHILHPRPAGKHLPDPLWDAFSQCFSSRQRAHVTRIYMFLMYCINDDKPLGGRRLQGSVDVATRSARVQGLSPIYDYFFLKNTRYEIGLMYSLAAPCIVYHGMEYLIMPPSFYTPQQIEHYQPMDFRISESLRRAAFRQLRTNFFDEPESRISELVKQLNGTLFRRCSGFGHAAFSPY